MVDRLWGGPPRTVDVVAGREGRLHGLVFACVRVIWGSKPLACARAIISGMRALSSRACLHSRSRRVRYRCGSRQRSAKIDAKGLKKKISYFVRYCCGGSTGHIFVSEVCMSRARSHWRPQAFTFTKDDDTHIHIHILSRTSSARRGRCIARLGASLIHKYTTPFLEKWGARLLDQGTRGVGLQGKTPNRSP